MAMFLMLVQPGAPAAPPAATIDNGKVRAALYLPDAEETNARDGGYHPTLAIEYLSREAGAERAAFDFVLETA